MVLESSIMQSNFPSGSTMQWGAGRDLTFLTLGIMYNYRQKSLLSMVHGHDVFIVKLTFYQLLRLHCFGV